MLIKKLTFKRMIFLKYISKVALYFSTLYFLAQFMDLTDVLANCCMFISIASILVNLPVIINTMFSWRDLLFSDVLLFNIFFTNLCGGLGYSIPLYDYYRSSVDKAPHCQYAGCIVFTSVCSNICTLEMLSIHQYLLVKKPLLAFRLNKRQGLGILCIVLAWLIGFGVAIPPFFSLSNYTIMNNFTCEIDFNSNDIIARTYHLGLFVVCYLMPLFIMVFCGYNCVTYVFFKHPQSIRRTTPRVFTLRERRFKRIIFGMTGSFLISWLPYGVLAALSVCQYKTPLVFHAICVIFAKLYTVTNTVVYFFAYNEVKCCRNNETNINLSSNRSYSRSRKYIQAPRPFVISVRQRYPNNEVAFEMTSL